MTEVTLSSETVRVSSGGNHFLRLLEILRPDFVMMMEAYFDESGTHEGSPVACVAGYLLTEDNARQFDNEWKRDLSDFGLSYFHAKEIVQLLPDPDQQRELMLRLVGIIKRRVEVGIAVSISETDFGQYAPPNWVQGGPYLLAALQVLGGVVAWAEKCSFDGEISYFFEAGDKHEKLTGNAIEMIVHSGAGSARSGAEYLRYKSHAFMKKKDSGILQASDLLANEWHKEIKRLNMPNPSNRPRRRSFDSLVERTHITQHYTAADLHLGFTKGFGSIIPNNEFRPVG